MKVKNLNHSSEKTKKIIRNTFVQLVQENEELSKITVSELVKRADINRGTFYNHYDNIYSIAEEFEAEIVHTLVEDNKLLNSQEEFNSYFDKVITYIKQNEKTYKLFLSSRRPQMFLEQLNTIVSDKLYKSILQANLKSENKYLKFSVSFFTDGIISQVLKYFSDSYDFSLDDIGNYAKQMFGLMFY